MYSPGRLEGMWLEAKGAWQQAEKVYSNLLAENPSDTVSEYSTSQDNFRMMFAFYREEFA